VVDLGLDQRLLLPRWINELGFQRLSPPGARGSAYIVLPNECGPSDQTNINRTVFLDPLGRWSMIREVERDWSLDPSGCPRGEGGRPTPGPDRPPAALPPGPIGLPFVPVASGLF